MSYSITAELPLGTYRGRAPDGSVEPAPSVARLHAALLSAAGFGPRALESPGGQGPNPDDAVALRWLEDNPPDAISIPPLLVNRSPAIAYRDDGTLAPGKAGMNKVGKGAGRSVAVAGAFSWSWSEPPPPTVAAVLEELCVDVSHLGSTESPVRLRAGASDHEPTHRLDREATLFAGAGDDVDLPGSGRTAELEVFHRGQRPAPSPAKDKVKTSEGSERTTPPRAEIRTGRYAPVTADAGEAPWPQVLLLDLGRRVPDRDKVRWATAVHRALVRLVGEGAPPLLTGAFPAGERRPTNRLALQILDPGLDAHPFGPQEHSSLAVMIPRDAAGPDVATVTGALRSLDTVRGPGGRLSRPSIARAVPGDRFWRPPAPGDVRLWRTSPAAVPDTRGAGRHWTFLHAALLSVGFVWQGSLHLPRVPGRGAQQHQRLVEAANDAGVAVVDTRAIHTSTVGDFVHHVNPGAVVRPYAAVLSLGDLGGPGTLQAIGQSRHLGGGLLVPVDRPADSEAPRATAGDLR